MRILLKFLQRLQKTGILSRISYKIPPHVLVNLYYSLIYPYLTSGVVGRERGERRSRTFFREGTRSLNILQHFWHSLIQYVTNNKFLCINLYNYIYYSFVILLHLTVSKIAALTLCK